MGDDEADKKVDDVTCSKERCSWDFPLVSTYRRRQRLLLNSQGLGRTGVVSHRCHSRSLTSLSKFRAPSSNHLPNHVRIFNTIPMSHSLHHINLLVTYTCQAIMNKLAPTHRRTLVSITRDDIDRTLDSTVLRWLGGLDGFTICAVSFRILRHDHFSNEGFLKLICGWPCCCGGDRVRHCFDATYQAKLRSVELGVSD